MARSLCQELKLNLKEQVQGLTFMSLKTRIGFYFSVIVAITLCGALGFIYYQFTHPDNIFEKRVATRTSEITKERLKRLNLQCREGDPETCLSIGYIYLRGVMDEENRDFKLAVDYFEKACDGFKDLNRKELQCEAIAKIFENGKEARPDRKFATIFHE